MASEGQTVVVPERAFSLERLVDNALQDCGYPGTSDALMILLRQDSELLAAMQRLVFSAMRAGCEVKHGA